MWNRRNVLFPRENARVTSLGDYASSENLSYACCSTSAKILILFFQSNYYTDRYFHYKRMWIMAAVGVRTFDWLLQTGRTESLILNTPHSGAPSLRFRASLASSSTDVKEADRGAEEAVHWICGEVGQKCSKWDSPGVFRVLPDRHGKYCYKKIVRH